jgi:hypothetical protein
MIRRAAAATLFVAILAAGVEPILISLPFRDRAPIAARYASMLDAAYPGYREFLEAVRTRTKDGDVIALVVPARRWEFGYSYAYYRASYVLAGREVLPLVWHHDELLPQNFGAATYVAAWHATVPGEVVLQTSGGVLVKRR